MNDGQRTAGYLPILQAGEFEIYPVPKGIGPNRFTFLDNNGTHFKIKNVHTGDEYYVSLTLVEFANPGSPGILRLTRETEARRNSLI